MAPGKKLSDPARKKLAGTHKKSVDNNVVSISPDIVRDVPIMPEWLSPGAQEVWASDVERIAAMGATAVDSSAVALYCETMAVFVASVRSGEPANAAFRSELRKQMELLGIAGAKSRLARIASAEPAKASPFSVRR
jgi:phage terminase small subunit